jgi:hypothetical protein
MKNKNYIIWILISILTVYSIFTFIWLGILYISNNGQSICDGDNFPCSIKFPLTSQVKNSQLIAANANKQFVQQKIAKNKLKSIYEELAVLDDNIVAEQSKLEKITKLYQKFFDTNIVFINKKPQILPSLTEDNYNKINQALQNELDSMKSKLAKKSERKDLLKQQVDGLYSDLAEKQTNNFAGNNNQTPVELIDPAEAVLESSEEQTTE